MLSSIKFVKPWPWHIFHFTEGQALCKVIHATQIFILFFIQDIYYMPVVNYLFFNSGDYFGRIISGIWGRVSMRLPVDLLFFWYNWMINVNILFQPRKNVHTVLLMVVLRMLYVPFFLCSNSAQHIFLPTLVSSDVAFILMMITFALSNGYLTNILLNMVPRYVWPQHCLLDVCNIVVYFIRCVMQHEKEMASSIMAACLSMGLALGSMITMLFVQML